MISRDDRYFVELRNGTERLAAEIREKAVEFDIRSVEETQRDLRAISATSMEYQTLLISLTVLNVRLEKEVRCSARRVSVCPCASSTA